VTKNTRTGEIGGDFYYVNDNDGYSYTKTSYVIENGKMRLTKNEKVTSEKYTVPIKYFDINKKDTETVIYGAQWLIQNDIALSGGSAKTRFNELQKTLATLRETKPESLTLVAEIFDEKTLIFGFSQTENGGLYYENGGEPTDFSFDKIGLATENSGLDYSPETYIISGGEIVYKPDRKK
jgi:hypothetical protein